MAWRPISRTEAATAAVAPKESVAAALAAVPCGFQGIRIVYRGSLRSQCVQHT